jgi:hypothetical protein
LRLSCWVDVVEAVVFVVAVGVSAALWSSLNACSLPADPPLAAIAGATPPAARAPAAARHAPASRRRRKRDMRAGAGTHGGYRLLEAR